MITTLLLLACSTEPNLDLKVDWELFEPDFESEVPIGRTLTWSAPATMVTVLDAAARDWELHLSCGVQLTHVEVGGDLQFSCGKPRYGQVWHPRQMGWDEQDSLAFNEAWCDRVPEAFALHAWGHQLGFSESFGPTYSIMDGLGVSIASFGRKPPVEWGALETDGLRIWAHRHGAPGCGNRELPWSWQSNPEVYRSHPGVEEANEMLRKR